jgi:alcohol dehydrogenase, propanol-preferring
MLKRYPRHGAANDAGSAGVTAFFRHHQHRMRAAVLEAQRSPLRTSEMPDPAPGPGQVLLTVRACGVCRTDLHLRDGEIAAPRLPLVLGHQIVAETPDGQRVGVPWLGWVCGECRYCSSGRENLCPYARFTGRDLDGGFAQLTVADERFCLTLSSDLDDAQAAPLLCGGLIGYRALRLAGDAPRLGLYGFGSAAHMICQVAVYEGREVYAFTRAGDERAQAFAAGLGAVWTGESSQRPPVELDAAIIFAPAGELVPTALRALAPGGSVVCAGIHMSDIPSFAYADLWHERTIRSVANLTRRDGEEFLALARRVPVRTQVTRYGLAQAEQALADLRAGALQGTAVVVPGADVS